MTVASLINDARSYVASTIDAADTAMNGAIDQVMGIGYVVPNYYPAVLPDAPTLDLNFTAPVLEPVDLTLPAEPDVSPVFQDIGEIEVGVAPTLDAVAPTVTLPSTPSQVAEFVTTLPAINTDLVFPEPPAELVAFSFTAPVLPDRTEPTAPTISLPGFEGVMPVDDTAAPTDLEGALKGAYLDISPQMRVELESQLDAMMLKINPQFHIQMAAIESQLSRYLEGGTGFNAAVENAIYERARDKNSAEARRTADGAFKEAADRGFTIPPGAALASIRMSRQAAADNNARAATEIVIKQAEIEQANLQFAVTTSANLRQVALSAAISYHGNLVNLNGQALEYAKNVLNAIIETYNIAVKAYGLKLDAYRAEGALYETRLKASMASIELYQAEIKSLEAMTQVDRSKVDIYRARIDSLNALAATYRSQIEVVLGKAALEKTKLDLFESQVRVYEATVRGKSAEWQGYIAALEGETSKVKVFGAQVDAYKGQVDGYRAAIDAQSEKVRATALTNQARAANHNAVLAGYTAVVNARGEAARTKIENQRQQILAFQAEIGAQSANAQIRAGYYKVNAEAAVSNADLQLRAQLGVADSTRAFGAVMAQLGTSLAQIYAGSAQAALSGQNSLAAQTAAE
jgi:hypothetical protein